MGKRAEQCLVQQFVAETAVEALAEGILLRLAGLDILPGNTALVRAQARIAFEVSSVPLSDVTAAGRPRPSMIRSSSRATRAPESELSATSARHSRV